MPILSEWDVHFPNCAPVGHHLRIVFAEHWVRFHSLPGAKRYPEQEAEYAEVLARHNCILGELAPLGTPVVLLTTEYSPSLLPPRASPELARIQPGGAAWRTVAMHEIDEDFHTPSYWHLFASLHQWHPGTFDRLVRLVADEVVFNVLIVSADCRWVLHPYDGGMDVITDSARARARLRARHAAWLSARPDGL
ncbi:MAG: hypothetical protein H0T73_13910 [Ardenticatenales bacterium]|nr:hypothetical protein [Ardenticatenales bacterium]